MFGLNTIRESSLLILKGHALYEATVDGKSLTNAALSGELVKAAETLSGDLVSATL